MKQPMTNSRTKWVGINLLLALMVVAASAMPAAAGGGIDHRKATVNLDENGIPDGTHRCAGTCPDDPEEETLCCFVGED